MFIGAPLGVIQYLKRAFLRSLVGPAFAYPVQDTGSGAAVIAAVYDDLNYPLALGELWSISKLPACREVYDTVKELDAIFGLEIGKGCYILQKKSPIECRRLYCKASLSDREMIRFTILYCAV